MSHDALAVATHGPGLYEVTDRVDTFLRDAGLRNGVLVAHVRHTSCSLLVQENADPDVRVDLAAFLARLAPPADAPGMEWVTHRMEGPDDMPAHIRATVLPTNLSIPVRDGRMVLGTWQGIYVVEHRTAPHRREVALCAMGDAS